MKFIDHVKNVILGWYKSQKNMQHDSTYIKFKNTFFIHDRTLNGTVNPK